MRAENRRAEYKMDALNRIVAVPAWAYDFCWFYFAVAVLILVNSVWALWRLFSLPSLVKKVIPTTSITIAILLSGAFSIVLSMMQFWICRRSLAPAGKKETFADLRKKGMLSGVAEKFAVACSTDADCTAVTGSQPAGSLCSCGGRGFCGGCVMNNNMEPAAADGLAPIEPFVSSQLRKVAMPKPSKMPMRR